MVSADDHARFAANEKQQSASLKAPVTRHCTEPTAVAIVRQSREPSSTSARPLHRRRVPIWKPRLLMYGRIRTRAHRGSARPSRSKRSKARAPTDRVRPAAPRRAFDDLTLLSRFLWRCHGSLDFLGYRVGAPVYPVETGATHDFRSCSGSYRGPVRRHVRADGPSADRGKPMRWQMET
jgi:hypothetical protein